jgi:3-dehydroquinate synthetase
MIPKRQLQARAAGSFEIHSAAPLLDADGAALDAAFPPGSRLLVAVDGEGRRQAEIGAWLAAQQRRRRIERYRLVPVAARGAASLATALELVQEGIACRLRRHDSFVSFAGPEGTDLAGFAAALFRRSTRCVRLHDDAEGLRHSLRRGRRAEVRLAEDGPRLAARPREVRCLVDGAAAGALQEPREPAEPPVSYSVEIEEGLLDPGNGCLASLLPGRPRVLALVDGYPGHPARLVREHLHRLTLRGVLAGAEVHVLRITSASKDMEAVLQVIRLAHAAGLGARDFLIAAGGGTLLDVVGFAAALYEGGLRYLRIPTTLVGMIDAGIGLKVGVNFAGHKNFLGAYHPPVACLCDLHFLETLPLDEIRCGLAEAVKIAIVRDAALFTRIEEDGGDLLARRRTPAVEAILSDSISLMLDELEKNPYEQDLRRLPDFGHEFGHTIEKLTGFRVRHGDAVAIGMALSSWLACSVGLLDRAGLDRILGLLLRLDLPVYHPCCEPAVLWREMEEGVLPHKAGRLHLVVPRRIGEGDFIDDLEEISLAMLTDACRGLAAVQALRREAS